jgi:integrase
LWSPSALLSDLWIRRVNFVKQREYPELGRTECRAFLAYLNTGNESGSGRWGNSAYTKPLRPSSAKTYHKWLRAFVNFCVAEGALDSSPTEGLAAPIAHADQIQPFSPEEVARLLVAARKSRHAKRDEAILLLLLDTGLRASELCALRAGDVDFDTRRVIVREGKGRKGRTVFCGRPTHKTLYAYRSAEPRVDDDLPFTGDRGTQAGEPLTRWGLLRREVVEKEPAPMPCCASGHPTRGA